MLKAQHVLQAERPASVLKLDANKQPFAICEYLRRLLLMLLGGLQFSCTNTIEGQLQVQPAGRPQALQPFYAFKGCSSRHCLLHNPAPFSKSLHMMESHRFCFSNKPRQRRCRQQQSASVLKVVQSRTAMDHRIGQKAGLTCICDCCRYMGFT